MVKLNSAAIYFSSHYFYTRGVSLYASKYWQGSKWKYFQNIILKGKHCSRERLARISIPNFGKRDCESCNLND